MINGGFRQVLSNLTITQATHPQNQAGKKHVSFASRQRNSTLQCTNSGRHDKPENHSGSTPSLQPRFVTVRLLVVPHPPYSPDLAPSDFWLFPKLKETLKGQNFSWDAQVEAAMCKWISSQPETFFIDGMNKWIERLKKMCSCKWRLC